MKKSKASQEETDMPMPMKEEYPYGLCITVEKEELKKLGIDKLPEIDAPFTMDAKCVVKSISAGASADHEHASVTLQITHMELEPEGEEQDDGKTASMMYDKMGKQETGK